LFFFAKNLLKKNSEISVIRVHRELLTVIASMILMQACGITPQIIAPPDKVEMAKLLARQPSLIAQQQAQLLAERPNQTDLYFLGFGADYSLNVFKEEVEFAQNLFDRRFVTQGRSTLLINNNNTRQQLPMANYNNLKKTLKYMGETMDREEDILFLFLTGHGIKEKGIIVNYGPQHHRIITPLFLKRALNQARIKWKIIVVSACYSGSFADYLADEYPLVITSSDADRMSWGYPNLAISSPSFISAFNKAKTGISRKEKIWKSKSSKPQIRVGQPMADKLKELHLN